MILTCWDEKKFALKVFFEDDVKLYNQVNTVHPIVTDREQGAIDADRVTPLTSVIYSPNLSYFVQSKFYATFVGKKISNFSIPNLKNFLNNKNCLLIVYGVSAAAVAANFEEILPVEENLLFGYSTPQSPINLPQRNAEKKLFFFEENINCPHIKVIRRRLLNTYTKNNVPINALFLQDLNKEQIFQKFYSKLSSVKFHTK